MFNDLFGWVGGLLSAIATFFKDAYEWLRKHIIRHIVAVLTGAYEILDNILQQIQRIIDKIRGWYFQHIFPILSTILNIISGVRVALALLKLLGVKWAAKLDAELQKIAGYITQSIQDVVGTLNTLSSYISLVVDPGMVLRADFWHASLGAGLAALKRFGAYGSNAPLSAQGQQAEQDSDTLLYQRAPLATTDAEGHVVAVPAYESVLQEIDAGTRDNLAQVH